MLGCHPDLNTSWPNKKLLVASSVAPNGVTTVPLGHTYPESVRLKCASSDEIIVWPVCPKFAVPVSEKIRGGGGGEGTGGGGDGAGGGGDGTGGGGDGGGDGIILHCTSTFFIAASPLFPEKPLYLNENDVESTTTSAIKLELVVSH